MWFTFEITKVNNFYDHFSYIDLIHKTRGKDLFTHVTNVNN
jgi:hypothetical protein